MTDNDIIKAFEICGTTNKCTECPYKNEVDCCEKNTHDVIDLINRQKAEIERLQKENSEGFAKWQILDKRTKERYAELYEEAKGVVRIEAIKEFAEKIKGKLDISVCGYSSEEVISDVVDTIDNIAKELTENQT